MTFVRWLLLTREGRRALLGVYVVAALISLVVYTIRYDIGYALGLAVMFVVAPLWIWWCLRPRSAPNS